MPSVRQLRPRYPNELRRIACGVALRDHSRRIAPHPQVEARQQCSLRPVVVASATTAAERAAKLRAKSAELDAVVLRGGAGTGQQPSVVYEFGGNRCVAFAQAARDAPTAVVGSAVAVIVTEQAEALFGGNAEQHWRPIAAVDRLHSGRIVAYLPDAAEHIVRFGAPKHELRQLDLTKVQVGGPGRLRGTPRDGAASR